MTLVLEEKTALRPWMQEPAFAAASLPPIRVPRLVHSLVCRPPPDAAVAAAPLTRLAAGGSASNGP
jgi:hypothetical protein